MTLADYLDVSRFPLTTRLGVGAAAQMFLDATHWEAIIQFEAAGCVLDAADLALKAELAAKIPHHPRLAAEMISAGEEPPLHFRAAMRRQPCRGGVI